MRKQMDTEIKVGLFVSIGLGLIMLAILILGGANSLFGREAKYYVHFTSVEGLISGAKVVMGGVTVGTIGGIDFDPQRGDITVEIEVQRKYGNWIRGGSQAEMLTQGVLGDKYLSLTSGNKTEPVIAPGGDIPAKASSGLAQFLTKGDQLMVSLNSIAVTMDHLLKAFETGNRSETFFSGMSSTAKNLSLATQKLNQQMDQIQLKSAIHNLNSILEKVNNGTGTLGALINDPGLYYDAKALLGGANRNRIIRNLVRKTVKDAEAAQPQEPPAPK